MELAKACLWLGLRFLPIGSWYPVAPGIHWLLVSIGSFRSSVVPLPGDNQQQRAFPGVHCSFVGDKGNPLRFSPRGRKTTPHRFTTKLFLFTTLFFPKGTKPKGAHNAAALSPCVVYFDPLGCPPPPGTTSRKGRISGPPGTSSKGGGEAVPPWDNQQQRAA